MVDNNTAKMWVINQGDEQFTDHVCLRYWSHAPYEDWHLHLGGSICNYGDHGDGAGGGDDGYADGGDAVDYPNLSRSSYIG